MIKRIYKVKGWRTIFSNSYLYLTYPDGSFYRYIIDDPLTFNMLQKPPYSKNLAELTSFLKTAKGENGELISFKKL
jgi:hypothetical protein